MIQGQAAGLSRLAPLVLPRCAPSQRWLTSFGCPSVPHVFRVSLPFRITLFLPLPGSGAACKGILVDGSKHGNFCARGTLLHARLNTPASPWCSAAWAPLPPQLSPPPAAAAAAAPLAAPSTWTAARALCWERPPRRSLPPPGVAPPVPGSRRGAAQRRLWQRAGPAPVHRLAGPDLHTVNSSGLCFAPRPDHVPVRGPLARLDRRARRELPACHTRLATACPEG